MSEAAYTELPDDEPMFTYSEDGAVRFVNDIVDHLGLRYFGVVDYEYEVDGIRSECGGTHRQPMFQFKICDHDEAYGVKCGICRGYSPFSWHRIRDEWAEKMEEFGVKWDPTIRF